MGFKQELADLKVRRQRAFVRSDDVALEAADQLIRDLKAKHRAGKLGAQLGQAAGERRRYAAGDFGVDWARLGSGRASAREWAEARLRFNGGVHPGHRRGRAEEALLAQYYASRDWRLSQMLGVVR